MRLSPGTRVDRFEILEPLGEGAYAETYKARDTRDERVVVMKSFNPNLFADLHTFQRFRREAQIVTKLDHPNVVHSLDDESHRTEPYLILEYIEGDNLRHYASHLGHPVPIDTAIDWGRQILAALGYLHAHGIVHRDLKPENVIIGTDGQLHIMDFGTALLDGAKRLTWRHLSESLGTPDYMSPEQIKGNRGDARSDIYAWGVFMYEVLTGEPPFRGDNWMATMAGHLQSDPKPLRSHRPDVPPALEAVVLHAMRRYPEHRYQSVAEVAHDLDHLDELDPASFDLSPEAPMGGMAAAESAKRLWAYVALIAVSFIGVCAVVITISVVVK
ncbi:MAG TPA: serine/threonine-protein kinase [Acidimicrobiia bacterium]